MALFFREFDPLTMAECVAGIDTYEDALKAYIQFVPIKLLSRKVKGIQRVSEAEGWARLQAAAVYKELNIDEIDSELPQTVRETVIKLNLIKAVVAKRLAWADNLYLHTLAQKVDNYLLKIKLTEYADWNEELWGATVVTDTSDLSELDLKWATLLCQASDKDIEQHTKVLVDKLEIAKTTKFRKPFKDAKAHSERCAKLNIGIYEYDEDYVKNKYELIWGGLE